MNKIVLIHGRSQQGKPEQQLKELWIDHLEKGFKKAGLTLSSDTEIVFPYYGDLLIDEIKASKSASTSTVARGNGEEIDPSIQFAIEFYSQLLENAGENPAALLSAQPGESAERGIQNWGIIRRLARALDNGGRLGEFTLQNATSDVFYYLNDSQVRHAVNDKVLKSFDSDTKIVIGHSLGSVVAYNVLSDSACPSNIRSLITLGSPLGLRAVKNKLSHPIRKPIKLNGPWYNFFDPVDIVALRPLDNNNFNILPPIINFGTVANAYSSHHGIEDYIGFLDVAKIIHKELTRDDI